MSWQGGIKGVLSVALDGLGEERTVAVDVIGEDVPDVSREGSPCIEGVQHASQTVDKHPIAGEGRPTF